MWKKCSVLMSTIPLWCHMDDRPVCVCLPQPFLHRHTSHTLRSVWEKSSDSHGVQRPSVPPWVVHRVSRDCEHHEWFTRGPEVMCALVFGSQGVHRPWALWGVHTGLKHCVGFTAHGECGSSLSYGISTFSSVIFKFIAAAPPFTSIQGLCSLWSCEN
jgi:hypothetical protein